MHRAAPPTKARIAQGKLSLSPPSTEVRSCDASVVELWIELAVINVEEAADPAVVAAIAVVIVVVVDAAVAVVGAVPVVATRRRFLSASSNMLYQICISGNGSPGFVACEYSGTGVSVQGNGHEERR